MSLEARIGEESTFSVDFFNDVGEPVDPVGTPQYEVYDHHNNFILNGSGVQDDGAPERWIAMALIPLGAPITDDPDDFYRVVWKITGRDGVKYSNSERFKVYDSTHEDLEPIEAIFGVEGDSYVEDRIITK